MQIQTNIPILDMVLDLIPVHFFDIQILIEGKNAIIFGVYNSSSVHINNKKDTLVLREGPTQRLNDTLILQDEKENFV